MTSLGQPVAGSSTRGKTPVICEPQTLGRMFKNVDRRVGLDQWPGKLSIYSGPAIFFPALDPQGLLLLAHA